MRHLGDITKISGYTAPIVDCIIGGSPCQDLSVAGKRAGLDGERSGLYIEQVRIVKEMRERDERNGRSGVDIRPRYMVWENVPGAFSSNKGDDFRIVLEELAKVCDKDAVIPRPADGKWRTSGCIVGRGYSIAWHVLDAQFWGVPQRRRRIALVADFGGQSAPEILFVRQSVSGNTDEGKQKRKGTPYDAQGGIGADDIFCLDGDKINKVGAFCPETGGNDSSRSVAYQEGLSPTLRAGFTPATVYALDRASYQDKVGALCARDYKGVGSQYVEEDKLVCYWDGGQVAGTLTANNAGGNQRMPDKDNFNCVIQESVTSSDGDIAGTLDASYYKGTGTGMGRERTYIAYCIGNGQAHDAQKLDKELCKTLNCMVDPMKVCIAAVDCRNATEASIAGALQSNSAHSLNGNNVVRTRYIVRRLTPLECERLQGYPDGWTDIGEWTDSKGKVRQTSDAARYKALGNSIALPPWKWVLKRLCACYERDATMASLFDGIGGFPYLWDQLNGKGSCLWASEIEEFPMAVTKVRIGE